MSPAKPIVELLKVESSYENIKHYYSPDHPCHISTIPESSQPDPDNAEGVAVSDHAYGDEDNLFEIDWFQFL